MKDNVIEFLRKKDYKFIQSIGQGGTGKTILIEDETINEKFVCKKYAPLIDYIKPIYFKNFIDEIKLLHRLYHKNVVRVFNYYLYPEQTTGFILMEFIDGQSISKYIQDKPEMISDIFTQVIDGFRHLEEAGILHRDIRPENILISTDGIVKIIDFGFGKKIEFDEDFDKSISINWRYQPPREFADEMYDYKTEIYFVGKLFEEIINELDIQHFRYSNLLQKMVDSNYSSRIDSFFDVERQVISGEMSDIVFSSNEINAYQYFANSMTNLISKLEIRTTYVSNIDAIQLALEDIHRNSILENNIQNPGALIQKFLRGKVYFNKKYEFNVNVVKGFLKLIKSSPVDKKKIILNNLWQRFDSLPRYDFESTELPF